MDPRDAQAPTQPKTQGNGTGTYRVEADGNGAAAPPERARPGWIRPALLVGGIVVVVLVLIYGVRFISYALSHESTDDASVQADTVVVTSKISERVNRVLVDTDQNVKRGQLLIALDDRDELTRVQQARAALNAQIAQSHAAVENVDLTRAQQTAQITQNTGGIAAAQAQIASASAQYANAERQVSVATSQYRAAQAVIPAAQAALQRANADFARTASLVRTGDEPQQQLDAARAAQAQAASDARQANDNASAAQQRVTAAQAQADAARAIINANQGQLQTAQGRLAEAATPYRVSTQEAQAQATTAQAGSLAAQLRQAQDQLSYTRIVSPIDGYVGEKDVEIGQTVSPGTTLLAIVPATGIYITANYKETQIGNMRPGQHVDISVDAYKGTHFVGHVEAVGPAAQNEFALIPAQNATGNFVKVTQRIPVRILVDNPPADKPLRPGMSVETSVLVK